MPTIEVLDPAETRDALEGHRFGSSAVLSQIALHLMTLRDTDGSVFVSGLNESNINALRTKMARKDTKVTVRKVERDGERGHVLMATSA